MPKFEKLTEEMRPQDQTLDGAGWTFVEFKTLEQGGQFPDTMPQAIKATDAEGRWCIYVPLEDDEGNIIRPVSEGK